MAGDYQALTAEKLELTDFREKELLQNFNIGAKPKNSFQDGETETEYLARVCLDLCYHFRGVLTRVGLTRSSVELSDLLYSVVHGDERKKLTVGN